MRKAAVAAAIAVMMAGRAAPGRAQMVTGRDMPGYAEVFGLGPARQAKGWEVREVGVRAGRSEGANVLWPGETARFTFRFTNRTDRPLEAAGRLEVIPYGTRVPVGDVWTPHVFRIAGAGSLPLRVRVPAKGTADVVASPRIPARLGGYALVADLGPAGRAFCAALVRVPRPDPGRVQFPTYALDLPWPHETSEAVTTLFERLGVKGCRMGAGYYPTTAPDFAERTREFVQHLGWAWKHNITAMLTVGEGGAPMPLGRPRPWLAPDDVMLDTKSDYAWLPEYDADFRRWSRHFAGAYGWPKGPINAFELWNEPWEGISISGWGADMLRFREMYTQMALGIEDARREDGAKVLIGGACSSTNTRDKLFADGTNAFLKWLDFVSIHYQPLAADPALEKAWVNRRSPYGPVRVWDTESWVANAEDRVAAVIASMRAQGQSRTAGIYQGNVYTPEVLSDRPRVGIAQAWAPAAAVAATQKFIGQRPFRELLFRNGLPWVFVFGGRQRGAETQRGGRQPALNTQRSTPGADDGTVVVVGDLGGAYDRSRALFRDVTGLRNVQRAAAIRRQMAALPADARAETRQALQARLAAAQVVAGATLTLPTNGGEFVLYDFYGNPLPAVGGRIRVPLNGLGYFLRTRGARGSFARLLAALRTARIDGYVPLSLRARDLEAPIRSRPVVRVEVTNILNRPVAATLRASAGALTVAPSRQRIALRPHETRLVSLRIVGGRAAASNTYPLAIDCDAGADGRASLAEPLHVNLIARRTIVVDGDLRDWRGALPQPVSARGALAPGLTERAYLPFMPLEARAAAGEAVGYAACNRSFFYFAARIADRTPYAGNVRFETRDDDQYFYPAKVLTRDERKEIVWPAGVRRFSYRRDPDLPSGNGTDNVQLAFNVLPPERKSWLPFPPGTMPRFMIYQDTDYEFALNAVAPQHGGGTEVWLLQRPGMWRKHFYPRQPGAAIDGGPVRAAQLVMRRDGTTRIVEAAIPWTAMPEVRARLDAGRTVKFSFRVNDNGGPAMELAAGRSVSREGNPSFHNDWASHWANEIEFALDTGPRQGSKGGPGSRPRRSRVASGRGRGRP